jgi:hypothetical protein
MSTDLKLGSIDGCVLVRRPLNVTKLRLISRMSVVDIEW